MDQQVPQRLNIPNPIILPGMQIPSWRVDQAFQKGVERKMLITTWGGLGDQVCAEPTLRYALKLFNKCEITLASEHPSLFDHLKFKDVLDYKTVMQDQNITDKYILFDTVVNSDNLVWEFYSHCLVNAVDFASQCAFRMQLPIADREIKLVHGLPEDHMRGIDWTKAVVVHAGKHWPSKTFPKSWWDAVLLRLRDRGLVPVLIGKNTDDNRSTVDVDTDGCIDLRNRTSLKEMIFACQMARVVLTNDSSPLHIAASGDAWIGYIASCKHPDYITHWRNGQFQWREVNLGLDGIWNYIDQNPAQETEVKVDILPDGLMERLLPNPNVVADFAKKHCEDWTPRARAASDLILHP